MIKNFEFFLLIEALHINNDMNEYSDKIYSFIKNSTKSKFEFTDLSNKLNISKLVINIKVIGSSIYGQIDLNKSKETENGWLIHMDLDPNFKLYTLQHELSHVLRLTLIGKDKMLKNLNHIKTNVVFSKNEEIDKFFYYMYLANDEEINARVMETNGLIKEVMNINNASKITKLEFTKIISESDAYKKANDMINFKTDNVLKSFDKNQMNKLFYIIEENKSKLDIIQDGPFTKFRLFIKSIKDGMSYTTSFNIDDKYIYTPKKTKKFYDNWIPRQGEKLKRRLYSLYDNY